MEYVGGISGATLGYIHDNSRGAYFGWNYGYNRGKLLNYNLPKKKMTVIPRTFRKRTVARAARILTPLRTPQPRVGRRMSMSSVRSRRSSNSSGSTSYNLTRVRHAGATNVIVKKRGVKRKKGVTVSKNLRAKIHKVMENDALKGRTQEITYNSLSFPALDSNKQTVVDLTSMNTGLLNPHFSRSKVMDAASVLWNEKVQAETKTTVGDFDNNKLKVKVVDCDVRYNIKNNTQRKIYMEMMDCYPKNQNITESPTSVWFQEATKNNLLQGPNQNNVLPAELYTHPNMLHSFKDHYRVVTTRYELCPGGEASHIVKGPQNKVFDFTKFWHAGTFRNLHSDSCFTVVKYYTDLVGSEGGPHGRFNQGETGTQLKYRILFEVINRFTLEMPEQTGLIVPSGGAVANTVIPLGQRQWSYAMKTYGLTPTGSIVRIDDDAPGTVEFPPNA